MVVGLNYLLLFTFLDIKNSLLVKFKRSLLNFERNSTLLVIFLQC